MASAPTLANVLQQTKDIFYWKRRDLPSDQIERLWQQEWAKMGSGLSTSASNNLPQKRPAPASLATGVQGPPPKRPQPVGGPVLCSWFFGSDWSP